MFTRGVTGVIGGLQNSHPKAPQAKVSYNLQPVTGIHSAFGRQAQLPRVTFPASGQGSHGNQNRGVFGGMPGDMELSGIQSNLLVDEEFQLRRGGDSWHPSKQRRSGVPPSSPFLYWGPPEAQDLEKKMAVQQDFVQKGLPLSCPFQFSPAKRSFMQTTLI